MRLFYLKMFEVSYKNTLNQLDVGLKILESMGNEDESYKREPRTIDELDQEEGF